MCEFPSDGAICHLCDDGIRIFVSKISMNVCKVCLYSFDKYNIIELYLTRGK